MTHKDFEKLFFDRVAACEEVLLAKSREYSPGGDRLSSFKKSAAFQSCTPERALWGMISKHLVALSDFVDQLDGGGKCARKSVG